MAVAESERIQHHPGPPTQSNIVLALHIQHGDTAQQLYSPEHPSFGEEYSRLVLTQKTTPASSV